MHELELINEIEHNHFYINTYYNGHQKRFEAYIMDADGNLMMETYDETAAGAEYKAIDQSKRLVA